MRRHFRLSPLCGLLVASCLVGGCGVLGGLTGKGAVFGSSQQVTFRIAEGLNDNYPVAVELIVLYDKDLEAELGKLTSQQWFDQRQQVLRDFSSRQLMTFRWEWTPGQRAPAQKFSYRPGARSIIVFASYSSPGEHRVQLELPRKPLEVRLDAADFTVEESA